MFNVTLGYSLFLFFFGFAHFLFHYFPAAVDGHGAVPPSLPQFPIHQTVPAPLYAVAVRPAGEQQRAPPPK